MQRGSRYAAPFDLFGAHVQILIPSSGRILVHRATLSLVCNAIPDRRHPYHQDLNFTNPFHEQSHHYTSGLSTCSADINS